LSKGQIVRFVRNPPEDNMTGIWTYEYGLLVDIQAHRRSATVLCEGEVLIVDSSWCSLTGETRDFIDDLAESAKKSEMGSKKIR
tara:strand:- start:684 stop:935 length:252 start_codon:yes stop_codon:yes gene_type:complete